MGGNARSRCTRYKKSARLGVPKTILAKQISLGKLMNAHHFRLMICSCISYTKDCQLLRFPF